jgi:lipid-A-disaccharide synthase
LLAPFGATIAQIVERLGPVDAVIPAVPHLADEVRKAVSEWPVPVEIVQGEGAKFAAFRRAHAALACSGTVTLELALAGVPMVVAYRTDPLIDALRPFMRAPSIVLANLVIGSNAVPEFLNRTCTPDRLADALAPLLREGAARRAQLAAFEKLDALMDLGDATPSARAADTALAVLRETQAQRRLEIGM